MKRQISHTSQSAFRLYPEIQIDDEGINKIRLAIRTDDPEEIDEILNKIIETNSGLCKNMESSDPHFIYIKQQLLNNYPITFINNSIVTFAAKVGATKVLQYCVKQKVNINLSNGNKQTALHVCMNQVGILEPSVLETTATFLIAKGAGIYIDCKPSYIIFSSSFEENYKLVGFKNFEQCQRHFRR